MRHPGDHSDATLRRCRAIYAWCCTGRHRGTAHRGVHDVGSAPSWSLPLLSRGVQGRSGRSGTSVGGLGPRDRRIYLGKSINEYTVGAETAGWSQPGRSESQSLGGSASCRGTESGEETARHRNTVDRGRSSCRAWGGMSWRGTETMVEASDHRGARNDDGAEGTGGYLFPSAPW